MARKEGNKSPEQNKDSSDKQENKTNKAENRNQQNNSNQKNSRQENNSTNNSRENFGTNEQIVEQVNNKTKADNELSISQKNIERITIWMKENELREKAGLAKRHFLETDGTFDSVGNKRFGNGRENGGAFSPEQLQQIKELFNVQQPLSIGARVENNGVTVENPNQNITEAPANVINSPEVQTGAWNKVKGWFKSHPRLSSFITGAVAGGAVRTASKLAIFGAFGASLPATIAAGAIGGGAWEAIRKIREEAVTYDTESILRKLKAEPDNLKRAGMLASLEDLFNKERLSGNNADHASLRAALIDARANLQIMVDSNEGKFKHIKDKDKISYLLNLSRGVRGGIEKTNRGKEADKLMREIQNSLDKGKRDYGHVWKNKKGVVATSILRGAAYGALGGALGGALINGISHVGSEAWNWFSGAGSAVKHEVINTVGPSGSSFKTEYIAEANSKGYTGASRDALHQRLTDYVHDRPELAEQLRQNHGIEKLVYAEDYLKDKLVTQGAYTGNPIKFSGAELDEALNKAGILESDAKALTEGGVNSINELISKQPHFLSEATRRAMLDFPPGVTPTPEQFQIAFGEASASILESSNDPWVAPEAFPAMVGLLGAIAATELGVMAANKKDQNPNHNLNSQQYFTDARTREEQLLQQSRSNPRANNNVIPGTAISGAGLSNNNPNNPGDPGDFDNKGVPKNPNTPTTGGGEKLFTGMNSVDSDSSSSKKNPLDYDDAARNFDPDWELTEEQKEEKKRLKDKKFKTTEVENDLGDALTGSKDKSVKTKEVSAETEDLDANKEETENKDTAKEKAKTGIRFNFAGPKKSNKALKSALIKAFEGLNALGLKDEIKVTFNAGKPWGINRDKDGFSIDLRSDAKYSDVDYTGLKNVFLENKVSQLGRQIKAWIDKPIVLNKELRAKNKPELLVSPEDQYKATKAVTEALEFMDNGQRQKYFEKLQSIEFADAEDDTQSKTELILPMFKNKDGVYEYDDSMDKYKIFDLIVERGGGDTSLISKPTKTKNKNESSEDNEALNNNLDFSFYEDLDTASSADIKARYPKAMIDIHSLAIRDPEKGKAYARFLNAAKGYKNFPEDVKVWLGKESKDPNTTPGELFLDITKDTDSIRKDLHAGMRIARRPFLTENKDGLEKGTVEEKTENIAEIVEEKPVSKLKNPKIKTKPTLVGKSLDDLKGLKEEPETKEISEDTASAEVFESADIGQLKEKVSKIKESINYDGVPEIASRFEDYKGEPFQNIDKFLSDYNFNTNSSSSIDKSEIPAFDNYVKSRFVEAMDELTSITYPSDTDYEKMQDLYNQYINLGIK